MRYLKGTMHVCICFGKKDLVLHGFTDSDFAGCVDKRKSTTGYVFTLGGGAISWISRLQKCIALSTAEAEYVVATEACKEAIWLSRLVGDDVLLGEVPILHRDSQSAIQLARNPVFWSLQKP